MNQRSFASAEYALKKKRTRREKFLAEMECVLPWARLIAVIEPLYPSSGRVGRQPIGAHRILRMYCLHQWYGLANEALEDVPYNTTQHNTTRHDTTRRPGTARLRGHRPVARIGVRCHYAA